MGQGRRRVFLHERGFLHECAHAHHRRNFAAEAEDHQGFRQGDWPGNSPQARIVLITCTNARAHTLRYIYTHLSIYLPVYVCMYLWIDRSVCLSVCLYYIECNSHAHIAITHCLITHTEIDCAIRRRWISLFASGTLPPGHSMYIYIHILLLKFVFFLIREERQRKPELPPGHSRLAQCRRARCSGSLWRYRPLLTLV